MPYDVSWWKTGEVLYIKVYGQVTLDDLEQITRISLERLNETPLTVHAVTDALEVESLPHNIPALVKNMGAQRQRNSGFTIIVSGNRKIQFVANTLLQVLRMDVRLVSTLEEAQSLLEKMGITPST